MIGEQEYRLNSLLSNIDKYKNRRIALYGTGANARAILDLLPDETIVGLIDSQLTGKYLWNKKVLSLQELLILGVEVIIMAAETRAAAKIYPRIAEFCKTNQIEVLNMYGIPEHYLRRRLMEADLAYPLQSAEMLCKEINTHDLIVFQIRDVLLDINMGMSDSYYDRVWEKAESAMPKEIFIHLRNKAGLLQKRRLFHTINDIYDLFSYLGQSNSEETVRLFNAEWEVFKECIYVRTVLMDKCLWAINNGKKVYLYSDFSYNEYYIREILKCKGLTSENYVLLGEVDEKKFLSNGLFRSISENHPAHSVLYIGSGEKLEVPLIYEQDFFCIKSSRELMLADSYAEYTAEDLTVHPDSSSVLNEISMLWEDPFRVFRKPELVTTIEEMYIRGGIVFRRPVSPLVSIIIPVYDQYEMTYKCLKSLSLYTGDIDYEVIVADDCSQDFTCRIEEVVDGAVVLHNAINLGFLKNCNRAAGIAKGKYIVFLNNDTQVQVNWLLPLLQLMEKEKEVGIAGSMLLYPDGTLLETGNVVRRDGNIEHYGQGDSYIDAPWYHFVRDVDYVSGASFMIRKSLWEEIGGFDKRYEPAYYEDNDLAFEVRKRGYRVCCQPFSRVVHFEGKSHIEQPSIAVNNYKLKNRKLFCDKWRSILQNEHLSQEIYTLDCIDRKLKNKKVILFIIDTLTTQNMYMALGLLENNCIPKVIPMDFYGRRPYTEKLQWEGVEVLYGNYFRERVSDWLLKYQYEIDKALISVRDKMNKEIVLQLLNKTSIAYEFV